jgi:hypothetical protein
MFQQNTGRAATMRRRSPFGCLFGTLPFLACALLVGLFLVFPAWHARLNGIKTQGTVISTNDCSSSDSGGDVVLRAFLPADSGNSVTPTIRFTDTQGQQIEVTDSVCGDYTEGQTLTLWYLPNDPQTITTDQQLTTASIAGIVLLLFCVPFLIALLLLLARGVFFLFLLVRGSRQPQPAFVTSSPASVPPWYAPSGPALPAYNAPFAPTTPAFNAPPNLAPSTSRLPLRLGQTAEIAGGQWTATLTSVTTSSGDTRSHLTPGMTYLLIGVALRNRSSQPLDTFSVGRFLLWDAQGNEYQPALLSGTVFFLTGTLQPGEQQNEQLAFSVPEQVRQFSLTFQRDRTSPPLATWEINV